ncbi:hypothetical protein BDV25DRAFT_126318 [Aspergillus avenaceus]|uniref:Epidermal growth factor receptor-like transmembrane-juxtamembrane segment domain-containing protein n=1 Tax=Aspergillus avenaceus TaxID=36643 RepID=A0A5N6U8F3_ASPAV|nr:hypothetical protein BDV25DRAFT_126318 [Aspergillus avenaceus]
MNYNPPYGFPLRRNGTCLSTETSCGHTWGDFYACCPGNSKCPGAVQSIQNNVCCPEESDCTSPLKATPHCANDTATMFNHTGYFCCLEGQTGFWTDDPNNAVGCVDGVPTTSSPSSSNSSSTNKGAIAGGVIGGVAGLAILLALLWFFLRRRKQPPPPPPISMTTPANPFQDTPRELDSQANYPELADSSKQPVHELSSGRD